MTATTKITFNRDLNEYRVRLFVDGEYQAGADYYTDDKQDAADTAAHMAQHGGISDKTTDFALAEHIEYLIPSTDEQVIATQMTLANARAWQASHEQWCFCTDILDMLNLPRTDENIDLIERCFEVILKAQRITLTDDDRKWITATGSVHLYLGALRNKQRFMKSLTIYQQFADQLAAQIKRIEAYIAQEGM